MEGDGDLKAGNTAWKMFKVYCAVVILICIIILIFKIGVRK
jgi:hypothetical protein